MGQGLAYGYLHYEEMGEFLRTSPELRAMLLETAERGVEIARQIAPVGDPKYDTHAGRYLAGLEADVGESLKGDRQAGWVRATAPESVFVEWGSRNNEAHHVLLRTVQALTGE